VDALPAATGGQPESAAHRRLQGGATGSRIALRSRYDQGDLQVFDAEERQRFGDGDPGSDVDLCWELLYRLEPELYDRLIQAESLHPGILAWLPSRPRRVLEVAAGTGRLTIPLAARCSQLIAVEPAGPLRAILTGRLEAAGHRHARTVRGFFDKIPAPDGWADLVVACSALTPDPGHGGDAGLREMERCCCPGGLIAIVLPRHLDWLAARGFAHVSFPGDMVMQFSSPEEALELAGIFYPEAAAEVRRQAASAVPYDVVATCPPRDIAYKRKLAGA
jgi:SAM-dependent methyltransferase